MNIPNLSKQLEFNISELDAAIQAVVADCLVHYSSSYRLINLISTLDAEGGYRSTFRLAVSQVMTIVAATKVAVSSAVGDIVSSLISSEDSDELVVLRCATMLSLSRDNQLEATIREMLYSNAMNPSGIFYEWTNTGTQP